MRYCLYFCFLTLAMSCTQNTASDSSLEELFDLNQYLANISEDWSGKSITKEFSFNDLPKETVSIQNQEWREAIEVFNKYNINKPDFLDKFTETKEEGRVVYAASHKLPKVTKCTVCVSIDSVLIEYETKTIIGNSRHTVKVQPASLQIKRWEKYLFSEPTESSLRYAID